jgi:hypothetical protein
VFELLKKVHPHKAKRNEIVRNKVPITSAFRPRML